MNRLIIIGNGFDLAHNLKTKYIDFIEWYLNKAFNSIQEDIYNDELISIKEFPYNSISQKPKNNSLHYYIGFLERKSDRIMNLKGTEIGIKTSKRFIWNIHDAFFEKLICEYNSSPWVDIEMAYYNEIKEIMKNDDSKNRLQSMISLNATFSAIKKYFHEFFKTQRISPNSGYMQAGKHLSSSLHRAISFVA